MKLWKRTLSTKKNVTTTTVFLKDNVKEIGFADCVNLKIQKLIVCKQVLDENAVLKSIR